jgi:hypothetical protein
VQYGASVTDQSPFMNGLHLHLFNERDILMKADTQDGPRLTMIAVGCGDMQCKGPRMLDRESSSGRESSL